MISNQIREATVYIDGSGNSNRIQACACALFLNGDEEAQPIERTLLLPRGTTNNVGEYNGLILALRTAIEVGVSDLLIRSDSRLVVEQTLQKWDCLSDLLKPLLEKVWELANEFENIQIEWVPRERNKRADRLCRKAIALGEKNPFLKVEFAPISS